MERSSDHICPYCWVQSLSHDHVVDPYWKIDGRYSLSKRYCSSCQRCVIQLIEADLFIASEPLGISRRIRIWPRKPDRPPPSKEVPSHIAEDYNEACLVFHDSAKASAALSRRCLQNLLRETLGVKPSSLSDEIDEATNSGKIPTYLIESMHAVRHIGNFAAHPMKSKHTGEILPVEPHEAEWNLDVLWSLFEFFYIEPAATKTKVHQLSQKLAETGKQLMKQVERLARDRE